MAEKRTGVEKHTDAIVRKFLSKYPKIATAPLADLGDSALDRVLDAYESQGYYAARPGELYNFYENFETEGWHPYAKRAEKLEKKLLGPFEQDIKRLNAVEQLSEDTVKAFESIKYPCPADFIESLEWLKQRINLMAEYYDNVAGAFITALINNSPDDRFSFMCGMDCIGYGLKGNKTVTIKNKDRLPMCYIGIRMEGGTIIVEGDAGSFAGNRMTGGEIRIAGDAGNCLGIGMQGGRIAVDGNIGDHAGNCMSGGEIVASGNAGDNVGEGMSGGNIDVKGESGRLAGLFMQNGTITLRGETNSGLGEWMRGGRIEVHKIASFSKIGAVRGGDVRIKSMPWSTYKTLLTPAEEAGNESLYGTLQYEEKNFNRCKRLLDEKPRKELERLFEEAHRKFEF